MYEDPTGDICQRIMTVLSYITMMLALSVYYVYTSIKFKLIFARIALLRVRNEVYFFLLRKWNRLYYRHIWSWLVIFGLEHSRTWTEIGQYRLEVSAQCGYEIPRTPDMVEGLKQEGYL